MIDEWAERVVDELCERVPAYVKPRFVALSASPLGWRLNLYAGTAFRALSGLVARVHTEKGLEDFLQEKMERGHREVYALRGLEQWGARAKMRLIALCRNGRFAASLFLTLLSALGVCAAGGAQMGACAAASCLFWLSVAMEEGYAPVCAGVRQRYLAAALLRGVCMLPPLYAFFARYAHLGVPSNVVLQSAMVVTMLIHLAFFLPLIAFNRRQPALLRAMAGILGVVPALTAAAAIAAVFTSSGGPATALTGAALGALGALLAFAGDQTTSMVELGGIRLKLQDVYRFMFTTAGFALMIAGAWLSA